VVVGPVTVPPARLLEQAVAEAFVIRLAAASDGGGLLGLRGFEVTDAGSE
jgi:hypothetical protein